MTAQPLVSVIVPHYQDLEALDLCLGALQRQTYPADRLELIVADNNSPVGLDEVAKVVAGRARLVLATEKGAGPARNAAVAAAGGEILAFTDSDCVPRPHWIAEGVRALERWDFVGGEVEVLVQDEQRMTPVEAFERVFAFHNRDYVEKKGFTVTANLFCPRRVFDEVGEFRTAVSEDADWCRRALDAGFRIGFAAGAVVGHPARRTWPELRKKWQRLSSETFALGSKAPLARLRWLARTWALPASAVVHGLRVLTSPSLSSAGQRWSALATLFRIRLWRFVEGHRILWRND